MDKVEYLRQLNELARQADTFEICLPNGGQVGSLLGSIATDLEQMWDISLQPEQPIIPRSKQKKINYHPKSGWSGWLGKRKVATFENEETARQWLWGV